MTGLLLEYVELLTCHRREHRTGTSTDTRLTDFTHATADQRQYWSAVAELVLDHVNLMLDSARPSGTKVKTRSVASVLDDRTHLYPRPPHPTSAVEDRFLVDPRGHRSDPTPPKTHRSHWTASSLNDIGEKVDQNAVVRLSRARPRCVIVDISSHSGGVLPSAVRSNPYSDLRPGPHPELVEYPFYMSVDRAARNNQLFRNLLVAESFGE